MVVTSGSLRDCGKIRREVGKSLKNTSHPVLSATTSLTLPRNIWMELEFREQVSAPGMETLLTVLWKWHGGPCDSEPSVIRC